MENPFSLEFHDLIEKADKIRRDKWGNKVFFVQNLHLNYTNICVLHCKFCAFKRNKKDSDAYNMDIDTCVNYVAEKGADAKEVHIVGGLHPDYKFDYYVDMVKALKDNFPDKVFKAFTAVEIDFFTRLARLSAAEVLERLRAAGLEMMPGGGAEIFGENIRKEICPEKISAARWLEIHEIAHKSGLTTNCTMLYSHIENDDDKFKHLLALRELQEKTGGFSAFIPLSFQPDDTFLDGKFHATGVEDLRTVAAARIILENVPHIKAYWVMLGSKTAQIALRAGADDLDGTIVKENISYAAGNNTEEAMTVNNIIKLVKSAGMVPIERDSFYNELKIYG